MSVVDRLVTVGRRWLHEDTFELIVAPALADLQHAPSAAAWLTAATSFRAAFAQDLVTDLRDLLNDAPTLGVLILIQFCYYTGILLVAVAGRRVDELLPSLLNGEPRPFVAALIGIICFSGIPTLLCFWPPRRERTIAS